MDKIINWLLLTIIFVFDPLAIALVVAANFAFEQLRPKTKENLYGETVVIDDTEEDDGMWEDEEMEDFKQQFPEPAIPDEDDWEEAEERMNIIGQNGNEGEHYYEQGYTEEEKKLQDKIKKTSKAKKYGPKGWKTLTKKLNELKNNRNNNDDDDLTIRY